MPAWTPVPKPTGANYTNVNPDGKTQYDQADVIYDDPNIYYDGVDMFAWTDIAKPTGESNNSITVGIANGLLIPLTRSSVTSISISQWTKVNKPTT